jgi:transcriptional regulator with XRE-family HTH domain
MSNIRQAIRDELAATGMTQADLAAYLGASEKHVSQILTGRVAGSFGFLAKMAAACGLVITAQRADQAPPVPPGDTNLPAPPAAKGAPPAP